MSHTALSSLAVVLSHAQATVTRARHMVRHLGPPPIVTKRGERCPLCGHQLGARERRPPRDMRTAKGQVKRLPEEVLTWRRCGGCGLFQVGEQEAA